MKNTFLMLLGALTVAAVSAIIFMDSPGATAQNEDRPRPEDTTVQESYAECKDLLRIVGKKFESAPGGDSVSAYTCRVDAELVDPALPRSVTDLEIQVGRNRLQVTGAEIEMYRDTNDIVMVIPAIKTVHLYDAAASRMGGTEDLTQMMWLRDSMFTHSMIVECAEEHDSAGRPYKRMTLAPDAKARRYFGILSMEYLIDIASGQLREVTMIPATRQLYRRLTWTFGEIRTDIAPESFHRPVAERVLQGDGDRLTARYKGFTLSDNRSPIAAGSEQ